MRLLDKEEHIVYIETEKIKSNPFQPRRDFNENELKELSESIKVHGVVQPILVRKVDGNYQVVAGERRLRASQLAGLKVVPAIVKDVNGIDVAEISLIENIQRKNLNPVEESDAYSILTKKFGMIQEEIAERTGKSRSYIANVLRLQVLPEKVKEGLRTGVISMGHGKALLGLQDKEEIEETYEKILKGALTVRQTEKIVKEYNEGKRKKSIRRQTVTKIFMDARIYLNAIKKAINEIRKEGCKVDVVEKESETHIEIMIRIPKGESI